MKRSQRHMWLGLIRQMWRYRVVRPIRSMLFG